MKKLSIAFLVLLLVFSAVGCSSNAPSDANSATAGNSSEKPAEQKAEFAIGETWTVDGQWSLTQ